jgi:RNA polymerase sigma factor (sigma-70 family)
MEDHELLRQYVQSHSEEAFRGLVEKHLPMVFGAARRMARDGHLAEEVAQTVFATFAKKAESIRPPQVIAGWLYHTTCNLAKHTVRTEVRRREREQTAIAMQALESSPEPGRITEHLEPAMAELDELDRGALVLRYFEERSLREVGTELGISEDAARMRVNRALEKLRTVFNRQGIAVTSVALAAAISASTASAVPATLAAAITATVLTGNTIATTTTLTHAAITTMNWINAKSIAAMVGAAVLAGTGTYFARQREVNELQAANRQLMEQRDKFAAEQGANVAALTANTEELERLRKDAKDLPRLRNEVAQLKKQRDEVKKVVAQPAGATGGPLAPPVSGSGRYITIDQLANVGSATPEAAMQTAMWTMFKGSYEEALASATPELQKDGLRNPKTRELFETSRKQMAPLFKGLQIMARKVLADGKVEFKVKMDADPLPDTKAWMPGIAVYRLTNIDRAWKVGGATGYDAKWDQDGQVQILPE